MMRDNHVHTNHNHYTITLETTHDQKPCNMIRNSTALLQNECVCTFCHWPMSENWLLAADSRLLLAGRFLVASGSWLLASRCRRSAVGRALLAAGCWLVAAG